jgi:hypothetical protein
MMALNTMNLTIPSKKNGGGMLRARIWIVNKVLKSMSIPSPVTPHER